MSKKIIDLFSGCGGLTYGFYKNGFDIVESVEHWKPALDTYNLNYHKNEIVKDITDPEVIDNIKNKYHKKIDIVIGGFPCQGYSMAGRRDPNDERNQLYKYTIDIIKKVEPKLFVLENVKGILSFRENDGVLVIDKIISMLNDIGYYSKYILLDASNFGVPQKRERVIFIGSRKSQKKKVDDVIERLSETKLPVVTVRDAIEDLENIEENKGFNHIFSKHTPEMIEKIKQTPEGKSVMKGYSDAFRKQFYDKPSTTVKENHGGVHVHPTKHRVMTPRELARLQSFPDDFIFTSTKTNILKQIGNAVPPKLSEEIVKIIMEIFY
ncbi:DNA cytosine methyltransferase [Mycoplasmopsis verecunda]|uniref:Cytosine-specific methyltransferase n=1 Tax=Mycoplasmopsis verecunda TaxID=171291 RepID=A0A1T4L4V4_9BACT|nr:DNA cytosine methyltransferase [Mycoplasmopsis verecunda]WPB54432.1 DNA cytosine methyltransferase [Mycoplasmopsis verecunda]SJZ49581.1 DNA (cytosine-5)-methyltransferase 1 [Mycoplasmopsis verecunda]